MTPAAADRCAYNDDAVSAPIYLTADIRRIEQAAGEVTPALMERAGLAAADAAARLAPNTSKDILVLAGSGPEGLIGRASCRERV